MSKYDLHRIKDDCLQAAILANKEIIIAFNKPKEVEEKIDTKETSADLLTETDKKCEKLIIEYLKKRYPKFLFIGEESSENNTLTDEPTFIIDPVDGTTNFVHRINDVAVSIALAVNKKVVVGVCTFPITKEKYYAIKGYGAFMNDKRIKTSSVKDLTKSIISSNYPYYKHDHLYKTRFREIVGASKCHGFRVSGCAVRNLIYVARGSFDIFFEREQIKIWDIAASSLIITEAGGVMKNFSGGEFDLSAKVIEVVSCCNEELYKEFLKLKLVS